MNKQVPIVKLHRRKQDTNQTMSTGVVLDTQNNPLFASLMLERGWRNNESNVSCLPIGVYPLVLEYSPRFKMDLWEIKESGNRSECKFHKASFWKNLNGCVSPGRRALDMNADGYLDMKDSEKALADFHKALEGHTEALLIITGEPGIK